MCICQKKNVIELDEVKNSWYSTEMHVLKVHMAKQMIKKSWFQCLQLHHIVSCKEPLTTDGTADRMDLNDVIISIWQKTFIQMKAVRSVLKGKLVAAGDDVYATLSGTTNSVFMTEFDSFFFGLSFYVGWTSLFSSCIFEF